MDVLGIFTMKQAPNKFIITEIIASCIGIFAIFICILLGAAGVLDENTENIAATVIAALLMIVLVICTFVSWKYSRIKKK